MKLTELLLRWVMSVRAVCVSFLPALVLLGAYFAPSLVEAIEVSAREKLVDGTSQGQLLARENRGGEDVRTLQYKVDSNHSQAGISLVSNGTTNNIIATHIRFRFKAPPLHRIALEILDVQGLSQRYEVPRRLEALDNQGWASTVITVFHGQSTDVVNYRTISRMRFLVERPSGVDIANGVLAIRDIDAIRQPTTQNNGSSWLELSANLAGWSQQAILDGIAITSPIVSTVAASGNLVHTIPYDFSSAQTVGSRITFASPNAVGNFIEFSLRAPASLELSVSIKAAGQTGIVSYSVNHQNTPRDARGWASVLVPIVLSNSPIESITLTAKKGGALNQGEFSVRNLDILDSLPTQQSAPTPALVSFSSAPRYIQGNVVPTSPILISGSVATAQGLSYRIPYDLSNERPKVITQFPIAQPFPRGNTVRFQLRAPVGLRLGLNYVASGSTFGFHLMRPLNSLGSDVWVPYAIRLDQPYDEANPAAASSNASAALANGISQLELVVYPGDAPASAGDLLKLYASSGIVEIRGISVTDEDSQLSAMPFTSTHAGLGNRQIDPLSIQGVAASRSSINADSLSKVTAMGFRRVRTDIAWANVQNGLSAPFNFTQYIPALQTIAASQLEPIFVLAYNNAAYVGLDMVGDRNKSGIFTSENILAFRNFAVEATKFIRQYIPEQRRIFIEIWNEPNEYATFWTSNQQFQTAMYATDYSANAAWFGELLKSTATAVKLIPNCNCTVLSGGLARPAFFPYLEALASKLPQVPPVDGVGFHPYYTRTPEWGTNWAIRGNSILSQLSPSTPIWITEVGSTSARGPANQTVNGCLPQNRYRQAVVVARQVLGSWAIGNLSHVVYELSDTGSSARCGSNTDTFASDTNDQYNYGIFQTDLSEKPAATALRQIFSAVKGMKYDGLVTGSPSSLQAMKFSNGTTSSYIAWTSAWGSRGTVVVPPSCDVSEGGKPCLVSALRVDGSNANCVQYKRSTVPADVQLQPQGCEVTEDGGPVVFQFAASR